MSKTTEAMIIAAEKRAMQSAPVVDVAFLVMRKGVPSIYLNTKRLFERETFPVATTEIESIGLGECKHWPTEQLSVYLVPVFEELH